MLVQDVMRRDVFTVHEDDSLSVAIQAMLKRGVRHAPVLRDQTVVGVLSDRNVLGHRARHGRDGSVREAMTADPYVADPYESLATAAATMATRKIGCLPVVDREKLVGIITTTDLLTALAQEEVPPPPVSVLKARHIMRTKLETARADDTLLDAAYRMLQRGIRHLPVIDGEQHLIGMLSERDVRARIGDPRELAEATRALGHLTESRVEQAMIREPFTAGPEASLDAIGRMLADERIGAVPVVDDDEKLLGIISYVDVLHAMFGSERAPES